jgi:predicted GTPase
LQLIDFEGQNFKLNQEALKMLKSIDDEIIVVSIVGKARTGKSYLMNLLLDNIGKPGVRKRI